MRAAVHRAALARCCCRQSDAPRRSSPSAAVRLRCRGSPGSRGPSSTRRSPSARLYSTVPMLSQCPSIVTFSVGFACSFAMASSRIFSASGRRLKRSKSKCTSSNMIVCRRTTVRLTLPVAVPPRVVPRGHGGRDVALLVRRRPHRVRRVGVAERALRRASTDRSADRRRDRCRWRVRLLVCARLHGARIAAGGHRRRPVRRWRRGGGGGGVTVLVTVVVSLITRTRSRVAASRPDASRRGRRSPNGVVVDVEPADRAALGAEAVVDAGMCTKKPFDACQTPPTLMLVGIGNRAENRRDAAVLGDERRVDHEVLSLMTNSPCHSTSARSGDRLGKLRRGPT